MAQGQADPLIPARRAWERFGITPRTLDRWLDDECLGLPRPIVIKSRRYWREADLAAWERSRASKTEALSA